MQFKYDVFDRRIEKGTDTSSPFDLVDAVFERYAHDGIDLIFDFKDADGAGPQPTTLEKRYLHGPSVDMLLAQENTATQVVVWPLADELGTTRHLVNSDGSIAGHFVFDAYGKQTSGPTNLTRFLYTGRELDPETGLYYYRARYYDAGVGRFIAEDPIGFSAGDANLSRYVGNSPTMYVDPSGMEVAVGIAGSSTHSDSMDDLPEYHAGSGYWGDLGLRMKGLVWTGPKEAVCGIWTCVSHPIKTGSGIIYAASHPVEAAEAIVDDYKKKAETPEGQGAIVFEVVSTLATMGVSGGANAASKAGTIVGKLDDVGRVADKLGDAARLTDKAGDLGSAANIVEDAGRVGDKVEDLTGVGNKIDDAADAIVGNPNAVRPQVTTRLPDRATRELPDGEIRTKVEHDQARNFYKRNVKAARTWYEERTGTPWPENPDKPGTPQWSEHPRAIKNGGDPLFIEPGKGPDPNAPHQVIGADGLTDFQRFGRMGGRPKKK